MWYNDISLPWQSQNQDLRNLSQEIAQIQFGLQRMQRCLATEFKLLTFMTQTQHHVDKLNKNPEQYKLNRYPEYMTFQPSRVLIGDPKDKDNIENYINANFIDFLGKKAIATQAPISKSTFYNFWRMIQQHKVSNIFMLCNIIQKSKPKCDRYFPQNATTDTKLTEKQYQITLLSQFDVNNQKTIKIRKIQLKNTNTNRIQMITHYQLTDWLDGQIPNKTTKKWMDYLINQFLTTIKQDTTPLVHCSAGVGRTGTFIMMGLIRLLVANNSSISIFNQVRKIREQRWGMVHTQSQYEFLYGFAEREIDRHLHNGLGGFSSASSDSDEEQNHDITTN